MQMALKPYHLPSTCIRFLSAGNRSTCSLASLQTNTMRLRSGRPPGQQMLQTLHTRSYSPSTITAAVQQSSSIQGLQHINIQQPEYYTDSSDVVHARADPWEPSHVLPILQSLPDVRSVTLDMNQIMFHLAMTGSETRYHCETGNPEHVLQRRGLSAQCIGLCSWSVDEYSKVMIQHSTIRNLLLEIKKYINNRQQ